MKTVYSSIGEMKDTPAAVDRESGIIYLNPKMWFKLSRFQRKFLIQHELGHYNLDTTSEIEADAYAFDKLAGTEFQSLKQCIKCLETILDPTKPGHQVRIEALTQRALEWDRQHPIKQKLDKGSGGGNDGANFTNEAWQAMMNQSTAQTIAMKDMAIQLTEANQSTLTTLDNNRIIVYCIMGLAAVILLND